MAVGRICGSLGVQTTGLGDNPAKVASAANVMVLSPGGCSG